MKQVKRIVVAILGGTVLVIGLALLVLPGPAFVVLPLGLAILAIEFAWARRWLRSARALVQCRSRNGCRAANRKPTAQSVGRAAGFLFRQVRRTLAPRRKVT